jgi:hypothetical protein
VKTPSPRDGCFRASAPSTQWTEVACEGPPSATVHHSQPRLIDRSSRRAGTGDPDSVGNGVDWSSQVDGHLTWAQGSFPNSAGEETVGTETGDYYGNGCNGSPTISNGSNIYTLQLNANTFTTSAQGCNEIENCKGWQQFVYDSGSGTIYIQAWLLLYGTSCPNGWIQSGSNCFQNVVAGSVNDGGPGFSVSELPNMSLTGTAAAGGSDQLTLAVGSNAYMISTSDTVLDLSAGWTTVEFNVVGDGCSSQANFSGATYLNPLVLTSNGAIASPTCVPSNASNGGTGETNSLTLVPESCCSYAGAVSPSLYPAMEYAETNIANVEAPFCLLSDITPIAFNLLH